MELSCTEPEVLQPVSAARGFFFFICLRQWFFTIGALGKYAPKGFYKGTA